MTTAITEAPKMLPADIERVLVSGDLSKLSPEQRVSYVNATCNSLGLNPLTRPFEYVTLNGKLQLYAKKDAADQLRRINNVSIEKLDHRVIEGVLMVTAHARMANGRTDQATGAVNLGQLKGEALANAYMKAETKAKRRVTLSICGLGFLDESELADADDDGKGNKSFAKPSQFDLESRPFEDPAKPAEKPPETPPEPKPQAKVVEAEVVPETPKLAVPEPIAAWTRGKWKEPMGALKGKALAEARAAAFENGNADACAQACASIYDEVQARLATKNVAESDFADEVCRLGYEGIEFPADLWMKPSNYPAILELAKKLP